MLWLHLSCPLLPCSLSLEQESVLSLASTMAPGASLAKVSFLLCAHCWLPLGLAQVACCSQTALDYCPLCVFLETFHLSGNIPGVRWVAVTVEVLYASQLSQPWRCQDLVLTLHTGAQQPLWLWPGLQCCLAAHS